jgi:SAM-dependent methyltransferase
MCETAIPASSYQMDWNEIARSYSNVENSRRTIVFPFVRARLEESKAARLLDFGCGDGAFSLLCRDVAATIFNYDISTEMSALAREACAGLAGISVLATLEELDPGSIDAVTMNAVWMCLPDVEACATALRKMHTLLRSGGWLYASVTHPCFRDRRFSSYSTEFDQRNYLRNGTSFKVRVFDRNSLVEFTDTHWNLSAVTEQLADAGFALRRIHELPDAAWNAHQACGSPWIVLEAVKIA